MSTKLPGNITLKEREKACEWACEELDVVKLLGNSPILWNHKVSLAEPEECSVYGKSFCLAAV